MDKAPTAIRAGFTATWTRPVRPDDPGTLNFLLRTPKGPPVTGTCTTDGKAWTVTFGPDVTTTIDPGPAKLVGWFDDGAGTITQAYISDVQILPNPLKDSGDIDLRGPWTRIVAAIEDFWAQKISKGQLDVMASSVAGGAYSAQFSTPDKIQGFYMFASQQARAEREREAIANCEPVQSDIVAVF
jgi:hypothetical protein